MKRIKLTIAYDGTNYCGWQVQPNGITVEEVINKALEKGLLLINAGTNVIRFIPPLTITKENVDEMLEILKECL